MSEEQPKALLDAEGENLLEQEMDEELADEELENMAGGFAPVDIN